MILGDDRVLSLPLFPDLPPKKQKTLLCMSNQADRICFGSEIFINDVKSYHATPNMRKKNMLVSLCRFGTKPIPPHQMSRSSDGRTVE